MTSKAWQLLRAQALTSGHGRVVAEFFDIGHSRSIPWARRPEAAALLAALADPDRGFDAIVIGSSERAFYGQQFANMAPLFAHYGAAVWLPELGVDPGLISHDELMVLLGILSKREVARARIRARTSMTVQARDQGRYLGGRPPYGYRLVDAGPHPNRAEARRGVRLRKLDVDATTGPVVTWIFTQRLAGHSKARITRALNDAEIPSPGAADPERNAHRTVTRWTLTAVRAILANPRYTGRQVWNRQRTDHVLVDPDNTSLGHRDVMRWNGRDEWVISQRPAHPALVSEADFVRAQGIRATARTPGRTYLLAGMLVCGVCGRRMESCWANSKPSYRCRHGFSSATTPDPARLKNAYIREALLLRHLPALHVRLDGRPGPATPEAALSYLHAHGIRLIYDPTARTVTTDTEGRERVHLD
ncbi:recombinase family protein [Yinghuangia sp. ASG 101]|uniref:recombinase family protein n=1 Tax=Yinghuangia sp. ASG 101 TaxID=2896848 RepID=UPI001E55B34C|nr:recombinase family protein [Yinghuangia sp. ASG 101]UGQ13542.1 recombinase family protein [Yinghuangia sp. ASG 101]